MAAAHPVSMRDRIHPVVDRGTLRRPCERCGLSGRITVRLHGCFEVGPTGQHEPVVRDERCPDCRGRGYVPLEEPFCEECEAEFEPHELGCEDCAGSLPCRVLCRDCASEPGLHVVGCILAEELPLGEGEG